jgi:L-lactate dehydrogenase
MEENVKTRANKIRNKKGYTNEGISLSLLEITKAILNNENKVLNISTYLDEIYIGMPAIINIDGVKGIVNIDYTEDEKRKLSSSINKTRKVIEDMEV